jgi:hypothetical protein
MADPLLYFLDKLGTWPSGLSLASQWFVILDLNSVPALKGAVLKSNLNKLEPKWDIDPSVSSHLMTPQFQDNPQELIGCIFAREVNYPGESINVSYESLNAAGIMAPPTSFGREVYNKFSITILETNASFVDFVLRPWAILVGQHGLIARSERSNKNIRCPLIKIYLLAKVGEGKQFEVRKSINFINAAPVFVDNFVNSYEQEGIKYTKVDFVYDHYFISSERSGNYVGGSATGGSATGGSAPSVAPASSKVVPESSVFAVKTR